MEDALRYLSELNLQYVVRRIVKGLKWELEEAEEAVRKYKNFLMLRCLYPELSIIPTRAIDEAWHSHILYTREYTQDCQRIFGKYMHHNPATDEEAEHNIMDENYTLTLRLYEKHFQESYEHALDITRYF